MRTPASVTGELESVFERIRTERMADVPILNDKLGVEAVGFEPLGDDLLGVLVTPWFMNLMHLPREPDAWQADVAGEKSTLELPGGCFEFIAGNEEGIGSYRMCSLFSPVFEFGDHATAVATAVAVMDGVLRPAAETPANDEVDVPAAPAPRRMSRRELFRALASGE